MEEMKFEASQEELDLIDKIAERATREVSALYSRQSVRDAIQAVQQGGCKLDLQRLLDFPRLLFKLDIDGILQHMDWIPGKLFGYIPRCARIDVNERVYCQLAILVRTHTLRYVSGTDGAEDTVVAVQKDTSGGDFIDFIQEIPVSSLPCHQKEGKREVPDA